MGLEFPPGRRPPWLNERGELLLEKLPLDSTLAALPAESTRAGFMAMLEDPTCSQSTREKVRCILDGDHLRWERTGFGDQ